ncbi:hypothetical protein ACXR0O_07405 [Verrucomicrobiota bacterium sgz303538]
MHIVRPLLLITALILTAIPIAHAGGNYPLKTCIVSGEPLDGDMGPPVPVEYKGRQIMLCCKSCVKKFKGNPEKYGAELDRQLAKSGKSTKK